MKPVIMHLYSILFSGRAKLRLGVERAFREAAYSFL